MSIYTDMLAVLAGLAGDRIYPKAAPQECAHPFIVWRRDSSEPTVTVHGTTVATKSLFVFECWADTYLGALELSDQVRAAIEASSLESFMETNPGDEYEPQIDSYMEPVAIGFWH